MLTFTGKCRLRCLYGAVRLLGFAVASHQPGLPVFSPATHCALTLEALPADRPTAADVRQLRVAARAAMRAHSVPRGEYQPGGMRRAAGCGPPFRVRCRGGGGGAISRAVRGGRHFARGAGRHHFAPPPSVVAV